MLTPEEAARRLGIARRTVYRWVASGRLPATKLGRVVRIRADVVADAVANGLP